ncbi:MAG: phosphatidate cytidylyltransferase [Pseudomonadota bacterium]
MSDGAEKSEKWADLAVRMASGAALVSIGLAGVWMGGHAFHVLIAAIAGLMIWELSSMLAPQKRSLAVQLGGISALASLMAMYLPVGLALPILLAPAMVGFGQLGRARALYLIFATVVLLAGFGLANVRDDMGFVWMLWLVLVVVATDVVGYFAGRAIGGPKFWPTVSPKKTWSGTGFGWLAAAIVGLLFSLNTGAGIGLIGVSVAVSMASQMGDIAESAIKRRVGVKDSSQLIPGHGGLLDRFDGMLGASLFLLVVGNAFGDAPAVPG